VAPATGFGTHGEPPQQLALEAQAAPAAAHCAGAHRGTPTLSCLHVSSFSQLPLQQSHDELHDIVFSLQTSPSGLHPIGRRQIPTVAGAVMTQVTGLPEPPGRPVEPQQSASAVQRSPTTWHPLAGWHTKTPVGPQGAHARLQHPPPHAGSPLSPTVDRVPGQSCPSTAPQFAGPEGAVAPQVPRVCPAAIVQVPVQQSDDEAHASPPWPQKDDGWHAPFVQRPEQHWAFDAQALPSVPQVAFRAAHMPAVQVWLQQFPFDVHAWPSDVQDG
jgi:hypothetical protein